MVDHSILGSVSPTALHLTYGAFGDLCEKNYRFLNICKPERSLATKTPTFDDLLPVDDKLWDDGVGLPSFPSASYV